MKQELKTAAECYRELARVMEQFNVSALQAFRQGYIKVDGYTWPNMSTIPSFLVARGFEFAIAELEGKPVFIGDEIYYKAEKLTVSAHHQVFSDLCSWTPPKPKTVLVEISVEDANYAVRNWTTCKTTVAGGIGLACKKALEELK